MSLSTNIANVVQAIANQAKATRVLINANAADLSALTTTNKTNLVSAINEVASSVGEAGASINDTTTSTLSVWSSSKTNTEIGNKVAALVASAPGLLDTLDEIAAALGDDPNFATTITNSIALKAPLASPTFTGTVSGITKAMVGLGNVDDTSDANKPVSTAQQAALDLKEDKTAIGNTETDFVAVFNAGLV